MAGIYITPQISVNELSSIACLSKKQFERLFHSFVGINPKEYTRIVRFQKALAQMQHQAGKEINQAQIAYASGYADQSHFIRELRQRIYARVFAESIKSVFRFVHQSRVNVPFVLSGGKRFSYLCRLIH